MPTKAGSELSAISCKISNEGCESNDRERTNADLNRDLSAIQQKETKATKTALPFHSLL
jgi:hypothetical protein